MLLCGMAALTKEIKDTVLSLPERERIQLAGALLKSVPGELATSSEEVQDTWDNEISRRITEIDSGSVKLIPAAQVFDELNKEFDWKR